MRQEPDDEDHTGGQQAEEESREEDSPSDGEAANDEDEGFHSSDGEAANDEDEGLHSGAALAGAFINLASEAASTLTKTDPRVKLPSGGHAYKRTVVDEFNKSNGPLPRDRLARIRMSSHRDADFEAGRSSSSSSSSSSSLPADGPAVGVGGASVIPGADLAMAFMEDGKVVKWLGRVAVIYKEKAIWKSQVDLEDCDRSKFSVTCQWYSPVAGSRDLEYSFHEVSDRQRYSLVRCIGLVRIDFSDSGEGGIYRINENLNTALNEALEGTAETRISKRKDPDKASKAARKTNEACEYRNTLQRPRLNLGGSRNRSPGGGGAQAPAGE